MFYLDIVHYYPHDIMIPGVRNTIGKLLLEEINLEKNMQKLINFLLGPWRRYKERKAFEKRLEEMKKRDPFIYK